MLKLKNVKNDVNLRFSWAEIDEDVFERIQRHQSCYRVEWAYIEIKTGFRF